MSDTVSDLRAIAKEVLGAVVSVEPGTRDCDYLRIGDDKFLVHKENIAQIELRVRNVLIDAMYRFQARTRGILPHSDCV